MTLCTQESSYKRDKGVSKGNMWFVHLWMFREKKNQLKGHNLFSWRARGWEQSLCSNQEMGKWKQSLLNG